jgi:hypothetical protein
MLAFLSENNGDMEEFAFIESKDGTCEKCTVRAKNLPPESVLKSSENCLDGVWVSYSKYIAEQFTINKEPMTLPTNLHHRFVYQSWVEATHLDHIPRDKVNEPGIAAIQGHPELENGEVCMTLGLKAIDGSHRAALTYREGLPFSVLVLTPLELLKSTFAIDNKKNPFFERGYTKAAEELLTQMTRGEVDVWGNIVR